MAQQMDVLANIGTANFGETHCMTCGSVTPLPSSASDTICTFCEGYVLSAGKRLKPDDPFLLAQDSMKKSDWIGAIKNLDAVVAGNDPIKLFGAASIYTAFSDSAYNDVNYNLPGFMDKNADNRNDEPGKNPYNSMRLMAKAKEMLFNTIYIINTQTEIRDEATRYMEFMSEMKLNRFVQASKVLKRINDSKGKGLIWMSSNMVYAVEIKSKSAEGLITQLIQRDELNSLYYYARYYLDSKKLDPAGRALSLATKKAYMPNALRLLRKVRNAEDAMRL